MIKFTRLYFAYGKFICLLLVFFLSAHANSQNPDSTKLITHIGGAVTVTNNGISLIPTFSLGDPAAIFNLLIAKNKLSFEPEFRFALEGKPWSMVFWWRYNLLQNDKYSVNVGAHPAILFRTVIDSSNGEQNERLEAHRYFATELSPRMNLNKNVSIGVYYLYSHGFDKTAINNTHFITFNTSISNIRFTRFFFLRFVPQVYYLKMDHNDGFYISSVLTLGMRKLPLSFQSIMNKEIESEISTRRSFVWNVSVIYSFSKRYSEIGNK